MYCEIVIGPPGSGKSTYIMQKAEDIKHRNPYLINLDPGNTHSALYNYSIDTTIKTYQVKTGKGPNAAIKDILQDFVMNLESFYYENIDDKNNYFLIDLPGQVEFFITGDCLTKFVSFLVKKNMNVVIVNLVDLVFFNSSLLSSYMFTYISICRLEVPFVCVIAKCDKYNVYDMSYDLEDIAHLNVLDRIEPNNKYEKVVVGFLSDYFNTSFHILNYKDKLTKLLLMFSIDKCSGYCYSDDFDDKETYILDIKGDELYEKYRL